MDNKAPRHPPHLLNHVPPKRWLLIVGIVLALWAVALAVWWVQLRPASDLTPIARTTRPTLTAVEVGTPESGTEQTPTLEPQGTPVTMPVTRTAGEWVRSEDWLAMARAFDEERALSFCEKIARADARENSVHDTDVGLGRGHERADMRHQGDQRDLSDIGGFSCHVRTR